MARSVFRFLQRWAPYYILACRKILTTQSDHTIRSCLIEISKSKLRFKTKTNMVSLEGQHLAPFLQIYSPIVDNFRLILPQNPAKMFPIVGPTDIFSKSLVSVRSYVLNDEVPGETVQLLSKTGVPPLFLLKNHQH